MNILDIGMILWILMFGIVGWKKGVIKTSVSFIGMIIIFLISFAFKESLGNFFCKYFPFFSFGGSLKGIVSISILIYQLIAFFIIFGFLFGIYNILLKVTGIIQKLVNFTIILLLPSKIGGFIIGILEGWLTIFLFLLVIMVPLKDNSLFLESQLIDKVIYHTPILANSTKSITASITEVYHLTDQVSHHKITSNEANLKIIDVMLKDKIVRKKTIEQLIVLDKLKKIHGIDKILKQYE